MVKPIPEGFNSIIPYLIVRDANEAIEFYRKAFGAKIKRSIKGPYRKTIIQSELGISNSIIMLTEEILMMNVMSPKSPGGI